MPKSPQERGRRVEKRFAKQVDGRPQIASGALKGSKGDVVAENILYEHKLTTKGQYVLKLELLRKIEKEALKATKMPAFAIEFEDRAQFVVLRLDDYLELIKDAGL